MANRTDTFDRADNASSLGTPSDAGSSWVVGGTSAYGISGNQVYAVALNSGDKNAVLESGLTDVTVSLDLPTLAGGAIITFRYVDADNYLQFYWINGFVKLYRRLAGSDTELLTGTGTSPTNGDVISVVVSGASVVCKANGSPVTGLSYTITDGALLTGTKHGFQLISGAVRGDNFSITAVASMALSRDNALTGTGTGAAIGITGVGSSFSGSTVFTLAGPTGWSIASQSVTNATTASVTLNKGSGTGTITITETVTGALSATITATNAATSAGAGAWGTAATWDVLEVPAAANHAVTGHDVTLGGTRAITNLTLAAGSLTIQDGGTLTKSGTFDMAGGAVQVGEVGGTAAVLNLDGGTANNFGTANNQSGNVLRTRGTGWVIQTTAGTTGSGRAYFAGANLDSQELDIQGQGVLDLGDDTNPAFTISSSAAAKTHTISGAVLPEAAGAIRFDSTLPADVGLVVVNCSFKNAAVAGLYVTGTAGSPTADRILKGSVFFGLPRLPSDALEVGGPDPEDEVYFLAEGFTAVGTARMAFLQGFLLRGEFASSHPRWGDWSEFLQLAEVGVLDPDGTYTPGTPEDDLFGVSGDFHNPHWNTPVNGLAPGRYLVEDGCFESFRVNGTDSYGDIDYGPALAGYDSTYRRTITVPDHGYAMDMSDLRNPGCIVTHNGYADAPLTGPSSVYEHCTHFNGAQGFIHYLEAPPAGPPYGIEGQIASCQSNLVWNEATYSGAAFNYVAVPTQSTDPADVVDDFILVAGHNWTWNVRTDGESGIYRMNFSYVPAGDQSGDPLFSDYTVHFAKWVQSIEASWAGTPTPDIDDFRGRGLYKLSLKNEPGHADYDARYTLAAYLAYIRAGFRVGNVAARTASATGTVVGAVQDAPSAALTAAVTLMMC